MTIDSLHMCSMSSGNQWFAQLTKLVPAGLVAGTHQIKALVMVVLHQPLATVAASYSFNGLAYGALRLVDKAVQMGEGCGRRVSGWLCVAESFGPALTFLVYPMT
jgi:hypothetical protein